MKTKVALFITLLISISAVHAQNVTVSDYDVPVSTAKILRLTGGFNWSQTTGEVAGGSSVTNVTANNANLNVLYNSFYSSLPFAWFLDVYANGGKNFYNYNHDIGISPSARKYIWNERDWFGFARLDARHVNTFKQIESYFTVGGGYGRYINATALAKAVRIEEHLIREKVVSGYLSKSAMIKIANIIERESEYRGIYGDTYETQWYNDIEREIKTDEKLTGDNVGAIGILRMQQVLKGINERVNDRYYGWDATAGIRFNTSTSDKSPVQTPNLTIGGRYSHPITWRTQVNSFLNLGTPMDSSFFSNVFITAGADFIYELSNRINFVSGYRLTSRTPDVGDSWIDHNLGASFIFYLENQIYLGINGNLVRSGNPSQVAGTNYLPKTDLAMNITLQYNLY